ncbi:very-long-chain enoyl-CoA reductase [Elysia marginata]|uniref:Very-long-chain enoyl-CoA reductase n=1 Tax=Elysia marginata TaxID=1093978 RepID=A0AAV4FFK1_9GAST|nr:very-long-chain enoyl-CoA reductase [Elysia marginata]
MKPKVNRTLDSDIKKLSNQQKQLRLQIYNTQDPTNKANLKKKRNKTLHENQKKVQSLRNIELEQKIEVIDNANNDAMFSAVKALNPKTFENPKVEDNEGKLITNPNDILLTVAVHFINKLRDESLTDINPFQGKPRPLSKPISKAELRKSLNRLKNNKAAGDDQINSELLKYAPPLLDKTVADTLNKAFERHTDLNINKAWCPACHSKARQTKRPSRKLETITLLNAIRKALSLITLDRIRPKVEEYLAHSQSGFRTNRSTSDVVWTHK